MESLPLSSPDHKATSPGRLAPAAPPADTVILRIESTDNSTFPKLVLAVTSESANQTINVSPPVVINLAELLETHSTERMSFTQSFKSPSSAE